MTTIQNIVTVAVIGILGSFLVFPGTLFAQEKQILSVTPPLFQLSIDPGDIWKSSIKVVNGNPYPLTVFAEVVNFAPEGELGRGKFIPIASDDDSNTTLASWIEISGGPHMIPPEQTKEVQFFVDVPEDASPGGHFAAILIGTEPPQSEDNLAVLTSQVVTTLFFTRVEGNVIEKGDIREFSATDPFIPDPNAEFVLRFENKGNVHLQPRGNILITNMWGKERGTIPINHQSHFGNVLPESIREFNFTWKGEKSITEIGRYKAIATLAYGKDGIKNTTAITYFWVIPVKATLMTLVGVIAFILFVTWAIKLYIRRMLVLAGVDVREHREAKRQKSGEGVSGDINLMSYEKVAAPIRSGAVDLRERLTGVGRFGDVIRTLGGFIVHYRIFFISAVVISVGFVALVYFISSASTDQKNYEVTIERSDGSTTVSSEEIIKERIQEGVPSDINREQHFDLELINESGEPGVAASAALLLEGAGYKITALDTSIGVRSSNTIIVFDSAVKMEAEALQAIFEGSVLSEVEDLPEDDARPTIKIFFGADRL